MNNSDVPADNVPALLNMVPSEEYDKYRAHKDLPTLPKFIEKILDHLRDPNGGLDRVAELVRKDGVLSGRLLSLSQTAVFGSYVCDDVADVIHRLGTRRLEGIVLAVGAISACRAIQPGFSQWSYWVGAATRGTLAEQLAAHNPALSPSVAYTMGIMSGLGRLVIGQVSPSYQLKILKEARRYAQSYHDAAKQFGFRDDLIGCFLLQRWGISQHVIEGIKTHWGPLETLSSSAAILRLLQGLSKTRLPGDHDDPAVGQMEILRKILGVDTHVITEVYSNQRNAYEAAIAVVSSVCK